MRSGKVRKNEKRRLALAMLLLVSVTCGPGTGCGPPKGSEVREPEAAAGPETPDMKEEAPDAADEEAPDPADPENLACAVFDALVKKDANAYKALVPSSAGDAQELAGMTGQGQVLTDDEIAALADKKASKFKGRLRFCRGHQVHHGIGRNARHHHHR